MINFKQLEYPVLVYSILFFEVVFTFIFLPILINSFGEASFGNWIIFLSFLNLLLFVDGGLSGFYLSTLRNALAKDRPVIASQSKKIFLYLLFISPLLCLATYLFNYFYFLSPFDYVFLGVVFFSILLQLINNLNEAILIGCGFEILSKRIILISVFIQYLSLYLLIKLGFSLISVPISLLIRFLFIFASQNISIAIKKLSASGLKSISKDIREGYRINIFGKFFSALNANTFLIILGIAYNSYFVVLISIASRFNQLIATLLDRLNIIILPRIIERKELLAPLRKIKLTQIFITLILISVLMASLNTYFIDFWFEGRYSYNLIDLIFLSLYFIVQATSNFFSYQLVSIKKFQLISKIVAFENALKLVSLSLIFLNFNFYLIMVVMINLLFIYKYLNVWKENI